MISLPAKLMLNCSSCRRGFTIESAEISDRFSISCPFCGIENAILHTLPTNIRLHVYREIREQIEDKALEKANDSRPEDS